MLGETRVEHLARLGVQVDPSTLFQKKLLAGFLDGVQLGEDRALGDDAGREIRVLRTRLVLEELYLMGVVVLGYKFAQVRGSPQPRREFQRSGGLLRTLQLEGTNDLGLAKELGVADQGAVRGAQVAAAVAFEQPLAAHVLDHVRVVGDVVGQLQEVTVAPQRRGTLAVAQRDKV